MKIDSGTVSVDVRFARDNAGNWHFEYDIPNYRGSGQAITISSDLEFESEEAAREHARMAVMADLEKNQQEISERSRG